MFCTYAEGQTVPAGHDSATLGLNVPIGTVVETRHKKYVLFERGNWKQVGRANIGYYWGTDTASCLIRYIPTSRVLHIGKIV